MTMNKKNTLKVGGLLTVGLFTLSACAGNGSEAAADADTGALRSITIAVPPNAHALGPATALQEGFFEEAGLDVSLEHIQSGAEGAALLAGGDAQFAIFSIDNAINSVVEGHNNILTVPLAQQGPERSDEPHGFGPIIVEAGGDIESLQDLEGQRIGTSVLGGEAYLNAYQVLEDEGVDVSTIEWIQIPGPQQVSAVLQGQVAAAVTAEPNVSIGMLDGTIEPLINGDGVLPNAPAFALASDRTWAEENADLVRSVQNAVLEANTLLNSDRELAETSISEYMDLEDEVVSMMKMPRYSEEPLTAEDLQAVADRLVEFDILAQDEMPSLEDVIFNAE
ncbi:ABC transporter substrate-binding protein [Glutamicibacter arilaitensis]|uniref:ABC transporter substrate-binding protein n=1 Tax=Glutamicibacter arilaitensis TaxID=256701 RepID=UPI00384C5FE9